MTRIRPIDEAATSDSGSMDSTALGITPIQGPRSPRVRMVTEYPTQNELSTEELRKQLARWAIQPMQSVDEFRTLQKSAASVGWSLNDLMDAAEEQLPFSNRMAVKLYRNGGPVYRGIMDSAASTGRLAQNVTYRGLSYIPGMEYLATKADENNRLADIRAEVGNILDREGSFAEWATPFGAELTHMMAQGMFDVATVAAAPGVGGPAKNAQVLEGAVSASAQASKMLGQAKRASTAVSAYYGLRSAEQALTVAEDHGLQGGQRIGYAAGMGGIDAGLTMLFGRMALARGAATMEEAMMAGRPAVNSLIKRYGLREAMVGIGLEGGENAAIEASKILWGTHNGTDSMEEFESRVTKAGAAGAFMGAAAPAVHKFTVAMDSAIRGMPEVVKAHETVKAQTETGKTPEQILADVPKDASEDYKAAVQAEVEYLQQRSSLTKESLRNYDINGVSLGEQLDKIAALRAKNNAAMEAATAKAAAEGVAGTPEEISARAAIINKRNKLEQQAAGIETQLQEYDKQRAKLQVSVETMQQRMDSLLTGKVRPSIRPEVVPQVKFLSDTLRNLNENLTKANDTTLAGPERLKIVGDVQAEYKKFKQNLQEEAKQPGPGATIAKNLLSSTEFKTLNDSLKGLKAEETAKLEAADVTREDVQASLSQIERWFKDISDEQRSEIKQKVIDDLEVRRLANDIEDEHATIDRARKAELNNFLEYNGLEKVSDAEKISFLQSLEEAKARGLHGNALDIAARSLGSRTPLDRLSQVALQDRMRMYDREITELIRREKHAPEVSEKRNLNVQIGEVAAKGKLLADALAASGSEDARKMAYRRRQTFDQLSPSDILRKGAAAKGSALTTDEAKSILKDAAKVSRVLKRMETVDPASRFYDTLDLIRLKAQHRLANSIDSLRPRTFQERVGEGLISTHNAWKSWLTGFDMFPVFRQGVVMPVRSLSEAPPWWRAARDPRQAVRIEREIRNRELFEIGERAGLAHMKESDPLLSQEEVFLGTFERKVPLLGALQRANRVFLNKLRADTFDAYVRLYGLDNLTDGDLRSIADFVNTGTGRGTLYGFQQSSKAMHTLMTGPKFMMSRFEHGLGIPLYKAMWNGNKTASKIIAAQYAKQVVGLAMLTTFITTLGKYTWGDDEVEFFEHPLDRNFGRLRISDTYIDITGGLGRPWRIMGGLLGEGIAMATGDVGAIRDESKVFTGALTGALSPALASTISAYDVMTGHKNASAHMVDYLAPWALGDVGRAVSREGIGKAVPIGALSLFGAGGYQLQQSR